MSSRFDDAVEQVRSFTQTEKTLCFSVRDYRVLEHPAELNLAPMLGFRVEVHPTIQDGVVVVLDRHRNLVGAFRLDR